MIVRVAELNQFAQVNTVWSEQRAARCTLWVTPRCNPACTCDQLFNTPRDRPNIRRVTALPGEWRYYAMRPDAVAGLPERERLVQFIHRSTTRLWSMPITRSSMLYGSFNRRTPCDVVVDITGNGAEHAHFRTQTISRAGQDVAAIKQNLPSTLPQGSKDG